MKIEIIPLIWILLGLLAYIQDYQATVKRFQEMTSILDHFMLGLIAITLGPMLFIVNYVMKKEFPNQYK